MNSNERRLRTKMRLVTSHLFANELRSDEFRENYLTTSGWTPTSPVIPCEADTLFGEVYDMAATAIAACDASVIAVPVLFVGDSEDSVHLSLLTLRAATAERPVNDSAVGLDAIAHNVTMRQVCETLAPNKKWDTGDLGADVARRVAAAGV